MGENFAADMFAGSRGGTGGDEPGFTTFNSATVEANVKCGPRAVTFFFVNKAAERSILNFAPMADHVCAPARRVRYLVHRSTERHPRMGSHNHASLTCRF